MPCRDREAYNARRRDRYRTDSDFRRTENERTCRHQRGLRAAAKVAALPNLPASCFAGLVGLSRHQFASLCRKRIIPPVAGGRGCLKIVTTSQIFWTIIGLFVSKRGEQWYSPSVRRAFDLDKLQAFLHAVWEKPFPLRGDTEALLGYAAEGLAGREIRANTPHELRRMGAFLKAREAIG